MESKSLLRRVALAARPSSSASIILGILGMALWVVAVRQADFLRMGALGLVTVLDWSYFEGLALLIIGFAVELLRTPMRSRRLVILLVGLVVFMFGTPSAIEPIARLGDSWLLAGFTQYIFLHGHVLNNFDARFSWPGGFSLAAVLVHFTGQSNALGFLRWFPLVIELLYLPPLLVIARFSGVGRRAGWLGVALFYATNWIDQDYFSPQALNYLFFLVVVSLIFAAWRPTWRLPNGTVRAGLRGRFAESRAVLSRFRLAGNEALAVWSRGITLVILGLLGIICLASAISHQLTPYALILALVACLLTRRLGRPEIVILAVLVALGWLSLGATNYWIGHLYDIFGSVGQLGSTFGSNVTNRITGSASHLLIVKVRILLTLGVFFLAGIGFLRRAANSRALEFLAGVPFLLLAAQNYGGEGLLRVVLFSLPFSSLLAASAIIPTYRGTIRPWVRRIRVGRRGRSWLRLAVVVVALGCAVTTTVVVGGNDAFEAYSLGELHASEFTYAHVHSGQTVGLAAPFLPLGQQDLATVPIFIASDVGGVPTRRYLQKQLLKKRPSWIILSQSQEAWGEILQGFPKGWETKLEAVLLAKGYKLDAKWATAAVLQRTHKT